MNRKMVYYMTGRIILLEGALLLVPLLVSLIYQDPGTVPFLITIAICAAVGGALSCFFRKTSQVIFAKEGFLITALAWLSVSAIGAIPFVLSGQIPSYIDAFFETVSGFTTTGASILTHVESMSHSLLFWRSFTHWMGGMGVLVLMVAIMPNLSSRTIHVLRAEMPGPTMGKLVPRLRDTAKILYVLYFVLTAAEFVLLLAGGMPVFDSAIHALGTAGTGGFGIKGDSIASYSPYLQWVIAAFMMLFGVNFNLYYLLILRQFRSILRSEELWTYVIVVLSATGLIAWNILPLYQNLSEATRQAFFQVNTITSTTGFSTADFNQWPELSKTLLVLLMFMGGCAGSTAGGLKVSRLVMLYKIVKRELRHLLHPRSVGAVRFEGKTVDNTTLISVANYFAIYAGLFVVFLLIVSFQPGFNLQSNFTAVASCFNNIGPGLDLVGPAASFAAYKPVLKLVLSFAMLFGRLEIYPMLISMSPSTWLRK
ncbi:MAG: TrkH family potassium uptake protein [Oscillospiraceae bacterium]|nr:TrkH family potassium uptake protein [Oscillospiraceae bacterium]